MNIRPSRLLRFLALICAMGMLCASALAMPGHAPCDDVSHGISDSGAAFADSSRGRATYADDAELRRIRYAIGGSNLTSWAIDDSRSTTRGIVVVTRSASHAYDGDRNACCRGSSHSVSLGLRWSDPAFEGQNRFTAGALNSGTTCHYDHDLHDYDHGHMSDGPNLYAYVRCNPWTAWDPHGLEATVERTPREHRAKPSAEKLTSAQKSALSKVSKAAPSGSNTDTAMRMTAVLLNDSSMRLSPQQMESIRDRIEQSVESAYSGQDASLNQTWKMDMQIKVVNSAKDIREKDHVFVLKDILEPKISFSQIEFGGYAFVPEPKDSKITAGLGFGGNTIALSLKHILDSSGKPTESLDRLAPHEVGHTLGLQHPDTPGNPLGGSIRGANNGMWHHIPKNSVWVPSQIDEIHRMYSSGELNKGQVDIPSISNVMKTSK